MTQKDEEKNLTEFVSFVIHLFFISNLLLTDKHSMRSYTAPGESEWSCVC